MDSIRDRFGKGLKKRFGKAAKKDLVKAAGAVVESVWEADDIDREAMKDLTTPTSDFWTRGPGKIFAEGKERVWDIMMATKKQVEPLMEDLKPKMLAVKKENAKQLGQLVAQRMADPKRQEAQKQAQEIFNDLSGAYQQITGVLMKTHQKAKQASEEQMRKMESKKEEFKARIEEASNKLKAGAAKKMGKMKRKFEKLMAEGQKQYAENAPAMMEAFAKGQKEAGPARQTNLREELEVIAEAEEDSEEENWNWD